MNCQIVNHCHRIWSLTRALVGEVAVGTSGRNLTQKPVTPRGLIINLPYGRLSITKNLTTDYKNPSSRYAILTLYDATIYQKSKEIVKL